MPFPPRSGPAGRYFLLWLVLLAMYAPLVAGQVVYHRDVVRFMYPARWFLRNAIWGGEFPLWNPHQGLGFAVLGDPLYGLFYPPNWLLLLPGPLPQMLSWFSFGHLVFGATGCMVLAGRMGATGSASIVAGLAWGLSGFTTSEWTTGFLMLAGAWIPWCAIGLVHVVETLPRGRRAVIRAATLAALPIAMSLLLGEVFVAVMAIGCGMVIAIGWRFAREPSGGFAAGARAMAVMTGATTLGAAIAAIGVVPAARFAGNTGRATTLSLQVAEGWSLHPLRISELALPGIFGIAWEQRPNASWVPAIVGSAPLALSIYCGATVIALALVAIRLRAKNRSESEAITARIGIMIAVLCTLALLTTMGSWTPLHRLLRTVVPPLAYMRSPEKYLVLVVMMLSLLAALGAERMLSSGPQPWRRMVGWGGLLLIVGLAGPAIFPEDLVPNVRAGAVHACVLVLALLATALVHRRRPGLGRVLLPACIAIDLGIAMLPIQHFGASSNIAARPALAEAILADARTHGSTGAPPPRLFRGRRVADSVALQAGPIPPLTQLRDNTSVPLGIDILPGYDAAIPPVLNTLLDVGRAEILRLLSVQYALLSTREDGAEHALPALDPIADPFPGARLHRVNDSLPRAYVAHTTTELPQGASPESVLSPGVIAGETALVESGQGVAVAAPSDAAARARGPCTIEHYERNGLGARCTANARGLAVFVEQWAPGWQATVDGIPAPVVRVNFVCRGVPLPAGNHRIEMRYRPPGLRAGAFATGLALLFAVGCVWTTRDHRGPADVQESST